MSTKVIARTDERYYHTIPFYENLSISKYCFSKHHKLFLREKLFACIEPINFHYLYGRLVHQGNKVNNHVAKAFENQPRAHVHFIHLLFIACNYQNNHQLTFFPRDYWNMPNLVKQKVSENDTKTMDLQSLLKDNDFLIYWKHNDVFTNLSQIPLDFLAEHQKNLSIHSLSNRMKRAFYESAWNLLERNQSIKLNFTQLACKNHYQ